MSSGRKADSAVCRKAGLAAERDEGGTKTRKKYPDTFLSVFFFFFFILLDRYKKLHTHMLAHTHTRTQRTSAGSMKTKQQTSLYTATTHLVEGLVLKYIFADHKPLMSQGQCYCSYTELQNAEKIYATYFRQHKATVPLFAPVIRKHLTNIPNWLVFKIVS